MNSLTRVLVIILIFRSVQCSTLSDLLSYATSEVTSGISSLVNETSNLSFSNLLNLCSITENAALDLNGMIEKLNLNVSLTSILGSLNVTLSDSGLIDLKRLFSYFNATNQVNMTAIFSLLNLKLADDVLDLKSLIKNLTNVNLTEIVDSLSVNKSEAESLDFVRLGNKYNLTVEAHNVTTEDGYILQIFHIPGTGPSLLLSHGILDTSDGYLIRGNTSLAYILAQNGFDIWVMNYRGNRYSRSHETLDPDNDKVYWEFSMQEKGYYDLSAVIDYVLEKTEEDQLSVIGHSEGTATVFVLTSTRPEYNNKIKLFIALSPVCYLSDSGLALTTGVHLWPILNKLLLATGTQELLAYESLSRKLIQLLCLQGTVGYDLCVKVALGAVAGYSPDNLEQDFLSTLLGHYPGGASRKELNHYVQIGISDKFRQYDYASRNIEVYGSETAPNYNLQNVKCNVSLVEGRNDKILGQKAVMRLQSELPNVVDYYLVKYEQFNHVDHLYGRNAHEYLFPHIIELLISYN